MLKKLLFAALALFLGSSTSFADIVVLGRINNGTPDSFSFAPLRDLLAGEVFYFTDNGWTGSQFRGTLETDGDGSENLIKFTANTNIAAGTLILSTATSADFTWTATGSVPGGASGSFAPLALAQTGDQI